jgi:pyochelin biosynthetic protein PchC
VLDDPELLELVLPALRGDYRAAETYRYRPGPPLRCPIVALVGDADPRVSVDNARAWGEYSTGEFDLRVFPGGHFYLADQRPGVVDAILRSLHTNDRRKPEKQAPSGPRPAGR